MGVRPHTAPTGIGTSVDPGAPKPSVGLRSWSQAGLPAPPGLGAAPAPAPLGSASHIRVLYSATAPSPFPGTPQPTLGDVSLTGVLATRGPTAPGRTGAPRRPPSSTSPRRSGASAAWTGPCTSVRASPRASSAGRRGRLLSPAGRATARTRAAPSASSGDGRWAWWGRAGGRGQRWLARPRPWQERTGQTHEHHGRGASSPPGPGSCWARGREPNAGGRKAQLCEDRASVHMGPGAGPSRAGLWSRSLRIWGKKRLPFQSCSDPVSEESGKEGAGSQAGGEAPN